MQSSGGESNYRDRDRGSQKARGVAVERKLPPQLVAIAVLLKQADSFGALLQLSGALSGYLFVKFAPRRGIAFGFSERFFGMRNSYYRWKRRRAARKFEVYMRKQNREVHFDKEGRYVDPDELRRDPKDKRWMN